MPTIHLPPSLVNLFPGATRQVVVEAADVLDAMNELDRRWPGMRQRLCGAGPSIREHINVFVDGERAPLTQALSDRSVVHIMTAVSGGSVDAPRRAGVD